MRLFSVSLQTTGMYLRYVSVFLLLGIFRITWAQNFYVVAPNTFRIGAKETAAIAVEGNNGALANVFIQDHPGKIKNISETLLAVQPGQPQIFPVQLEPANFPPNFLTGPGSPKLVSVNVVTENFRKEILVPISIQSGYVFIQTDKPIYTPKERAHIRIIPLNEEELPSENAFTLQIKNPRGIIVEEKSFNPKTQRVKKIFETHIYRFPMYPVLGEWSATVLYGHNLQQNSTVYFELQEYVLPTFTVTLKTQEVILPSAEAISASVTAKHVYGKNVEGVVTFKIGVKGQGPEATFFAIVGPKELSDGTYDLRIRTDDLKRHKDIGWFPEIEGSYLVVEATVVDSATGNKEIAIDAKGRFSTSPFIISFKRCLKDFKPGLVSVFEADVNYIDGRPAAGISTLITATADGEPLNIIGNTAVSDENGKVAFEIQPELKHNTVSITIETNDERYEGNQAKGSFMQHKYKSEKKAYIALSRSTAQRLEPGDMFTNLIHFEPDRIKDAYYLVVAKGKIVDMNKLPAGQFKVQRVEFQIRHEMVPSFRVVVLAHYEGELIADSLKIDVKKVCDPKAQVSMVPEFNVKEPGNNGKIIIRGTSGTLVGLLGVDEAVYALSKKDLLTKSKVFNKIESHDLGCGPGGGLNINAVLGNAGITVGTNHYSPSLTHSCVEIKRRKREAAVDIVSNYFGTDRECCSLGIARDVHNRNCQERTNIIVSYLQNNHPTYNGNCSKIFLDCCIYAVENGLQDMTLTRNGLTVKNVHLARIGGDNVEEPIFIDASEEDIFEKDLTVRKDFRETWIFENINIGPDNKEEHGVSLPHSITTWVLQAVAVSPTHGICVAEPEKIVSFKKIFVHLNLPYSVVRNEQVEIQATVFNYGNTRISALVYMYGAKDLCTGTQEGEKSERKRLFIDAQSAKSVSFPVIPLKAEDFSIKVVALSPEGSDVIIKKLHVVPEGVTKEIDIPIKLDPANQQRRAKRHIKTEIYSDTIDPSQNIQVTAVKLNAPEGFVPGTASCSITALGDQFGTVVETAINNPEGLLQKPRGCGEQNMMFLAPTLYTMRYMKVTGKLTGEMEEKGYGFIRLGYGNQLAFRKEDGSYAAYQSKPTSAWLTAFVMKVFCQASELVHIDENVLCSGIKWLINNQEADGSYMEKNPMYHLDMMGGVKGKTPMTAFTLIALEECKCDEQNLLLAKKRAVSYLEDHLGDVNAPLPIAIMAYALALSDSDLKEAANDRLLSLAQFDENENKMHWVTDNAAQDIETAGYALLTQLLFSDMDKSSAIVNWLNTKQLQSGSFKSTQDTVVALQGLSEYAIRAQMPSINLVSNISSSNDRTFRKTLTFHEGNAFVLQDVKVDKIGGTLFINTQGHGVGSLAVKLRYNVVVPPEQLCKFDTTIDVTEPKQEAEVDEDEFDVALINPRGKDMFDRFPNDLIRGVAKALDEEVPVLVADPRNRGRKASLVAAPELRARKRTVLARVKRQNAVENSKMKLNISICVRHLGNEDTGMSIVDAGIFSGFEPVVPDLQKLQDDPTHLIDRYEKSSRGVVFYLRKVPVNEKYCFAFNVIRDYIVGNTQTSVVKVYDYYNPDETCTKFYSPGSNSPVLRTICDGGICECAEGGCPPKTQFPEAVALNTQDERREKLKEIACDQYDYVWRGHLNGDIKKDGGFFNISFTIEDVIKEGIEKKADIEGLTRTLLARDNCETAVMFPGATYLILGKDGEKYENSNGEIWHRYILDKASVIYMWTKIKVAKDKELQRAWNYVAKNLKETGCGM